MSFPCCEVPYLNVWCAPHSSVQNHHNITCRKRMAAGTLLHTVLCIDPGMHETLGSWQTLIMTFPICHIWLQYITILDRRFTIRFHYVKCRHPALLAIIKRAQWKLYQIHVIYRVHRPYKFWYCIDYL